VSSSPGTAVEICSACAAECTGRRSRRVAPDDEAAQVEAHLRAFPILRLQALEDFSLAAELYRTARRHGVRIRKTLACLIAAPCVQAGAPLLHADADFDRLASCTPLRIHEPRR